MITGITSLLDLQLLIKSSFSNWKDYGEVSVAKKGSLLLFNYTSKAQYDRRWNYFEIISRGLIVSNTGEIVARPFDKIFNWTEGGRVSKGYIKSVTEKIDGSLGILYRHNGEYCISTRGSFESEQAIWATEFLKRFNIKDLPNELTLLFEIVYPENRIVIDYEGKEDLILLAARNRFTGEYLSFYPDLYNLSQKYGFTLPTYYSFNSITDILEVLGKLDSNQEGYVVEFSDGQRFKFKGDAYLELHKLISGISFKNTVKLVQFGKVNEFRKSIPDEFLTQFNEWVIEINLKIEAIKKEAAQLFKIAPKTSRKEFALWAKSQKLAPYLFYLLDNKDLTDLIFKLEF